MNTTKPASVPNVSRSLQEELRGLAESITEIVQGIRQAQEPLAESQRHLPQATQQLEKITRETEDAAHRVLDRVEAITAREGEIDTLLKDLRRALPATYFRNQSKVKAVVEKIRDCARSNQDDAYTIMDALQFQDITTQQINHAIALLEQVETRLQSVLVNFDGADQTESAEPRRQRAFDPNAKFSGDANRQSSVDELIDKFSGNR